MTADELDAAIGRVARAWTDWLADLQRPYDPRPAPFTGPSHNPPAAPGSAPHNRIAGTFEEQLARARRAGRRRPTVRQLLHRLRAELADLSAVVVALERRTSTRRRPS
jgi:hypothetical protein